MKHDFHRLFVPEDAIRRDGNGLGAARGIAIGGLFGAVAWLLVTLALSVFLSCA